MIAPVTSSPPRSHASAFPTSTCDGDGAAVKNGELNFGAKKSNAREYLPHSTSPHPNLVTTHVRMQHPRGRHGAAQTVTEEQAESMATNGREEGTAAAETTRAAPAECTAGARRPPATRKARRSARRRTAGRKAGRRLGRRGWRRRSVQLSWGRPWPKTPSLFAVVCCVGVSRANAYDVQTIPVNELRANSNAFF